jgi:hypothetical protein
MEKGYEMYKIVKKSYRQSIGPIAAYVVISTWLGKTKDIEMPLLTCEDLYALLDPKRLCHCLLLVVI